MKNSNVSTIIIVCLLVLSLAGNVFLFYQYNQQKNEILEYRVQLTQLVDAIEHYENANAGAKTYDALSAWWETAKDTLSDALKYSTELDEKYNNKGD